MSFVSKWFLLLTLFGLTSCSVVPTKWDIPPTEVVDLGDGTYCITRDARSVFTSLKKLEERVRLDASEYCQANHLSYEVVSVETEDVSFLADDGFSQVKLVFKAWPKTNPYASNAASVNRNAAPVSQVAPVGYTSASAPQSPPPTATDRMYEDLMKLDDLLKKGILTDEEFAQEKQKVLNRYQ